MPEVSTEGIVMPKGEAEPNERAAIEASSDSSCVAQYETDLRKLTRELRVLLRHARAARDLLGSTSAPAAFARGAAAMTSSKDTGELGSLQSRPKAASTSPTTSRTTNGSALSLPSSHLPAIRPRTSCRA